MFLSRVTVYTKSMQLVSTNGSIQSVDYSGCCLRVALPLDSRLDCLFKHIKKEKRGREPEVILISGGCGKREKKMDKALVHGRLSYLYFLPAHFDSEIDRNWSVPYVISWLFGMFLLCEDLRVACYRWQHHKFRFESWFFIISSSLFSFYCFRSRSVQHRIQINIMCVSISPIL